MNKIKITLAVITLSFSLLSGAVNALPTVKTPPQGFVAVEKATFADEFHSLAEY